MLNGSTGSGIGTSGARKKHAVQWSWHWKKDGMEDVVSERLWCIHKNTRSYHEWNGDLYREVKERQSKQNLSESPPSGPKYEWFTPTHREHDEAPPIASGTLRQTLSSSVSCVIWHGVYSMKIVENPLRQLIVPAFRDAYRQCRGMCDPYCGVIIWDVLVNVHKFLSS